MNVGWNVRSSTPHRGNRFSPLRNVQTDSGAQSAILLNEYKGLPPRVKRPEREAYAHLAPTFSMSAAAHVVTHHGVGWHKLFPVWRTKFVNGVKVILRPNRIFAASKTAQRYATATGLCPLLWPGSHSMHIAQSNGYYLSRWATKRAWYHLCNKVESNVRVG